MLEAQNQPAPTGLQEAAANDTTMADGLRALGGLRGAWVPPELQPRQLAVRSASVDDAAAVREVLARMASQPGSCGWLETPQSLQPLDEAHPPAADQTPLHAELACGHQSLHLRWAEGCWRLTWLEEDAADGQPVWAQDIQRLSSLHGVRHWQYRQYWTLAEDGRLISTAARLAAALP